MSISNLFQEFLSNIQINNGEQISARYAEITKSLNKKFRNSESETNNSLQVGSYGRWTAIKGISDLDMLYIMPRTSWDSYKDCKQPELLRDTKNAIQEQYPNTSISVDRLVVTISYQNFHIEVQPVFEEIAEDGSSYFKYPDTYNGGSWKITKPRQEIAAMKEFVDLKNQNLRKLCKMVRAWNNEHGVAIGGLLIDTLAHNFLKSTAEYDDKSYMYYDWMSRDFFKYLSELPEQTHYQALGSNQDVKVKNSFQKKAGEAYQNCLDSIENSGNEKEYDGWRAVYGKVFPKINVTNENTAFSKSYRNTEEFIENKNNYTVDIRYKIDLDCDVFQNGFRETTLRNMLAGKRRLQHKKQLTFKASPRNIPQPFILKWKVLNVGEEAINRDCIRGQIEADTGSMTKVEHTNFKGEHIVECYVIKNNVVVAKNRINVPIE